MERNQTDKMAQVLDGGSPQSCPDCGGGNFTIANIKQSFDYGLGDDVVVLTAEFPAWRCDACGFVLAGEEAEKSRTEAICAHLEILTPAQIRQIRQSAGLSQYAFAQLTDIGISTIKRWETGNFLQTRAHDNFLRLLRMPGGIEALQAVQRSREEAREACVVVTLAFRYIRREDYDGMASVFTLR